MFADRSDRQRQQRCGNVSRLPGGQWRGYHCASGKRQLGTQCRICRTNGQFGNPVGLPPITSQITIEGNGATIARQGDAPDFGLMAVRGSVFLGVGVPPGPGGI